MNPHAWHLSDLARVPQNGLKVMTTFSCGGGSSMGYKLTGCDVIAANDIDPVMAEHYTQNLHPKYLFLCPIKELLTAELPQELFRLDILDGSPPCSTFSHAGSREDSWGKNKHFREGQEKQVLSDLFFDWLNLVERLKPRTAIAENVKGLILGNAKGYVKLIMQRFQEIGYRAQLFLINAADCGVPQRRERVFFCAVRNDLDAPLLSLKPHARWIAAGEATADLQKLTTAEKQDTKASPNDLKCWPHTRCGDAYSTFLERSEGRRACFNNYRLPCESPSLTLTSQPSLFTHWSECRKLTFREWKRLGSFPDDYQVKADGIGKYIVGMSVPPKMMQYVAGEVISQCLKPELAHA